MGPKGMAETGGSRAKSAHNNQDGELYLAYLEEYHRGAPLDLEGPLFRLNRVLTLVLGAYVCNFDLMGGHEPASSSSLEEDEKPTRTVRRSAWRRRMRHAWIPWTILTLYLTIQLVLFLDTLLLYRHHLASLRLKRVRQLLVAYGPAQRVALEDPMGLPLAAQDHQLNVAVVAVVSLGELEGALAVRSQATRLQAHRLGDIFAEFGLINEFLYMALMSLGVGLYLVPQTVFLWMNRHDIQAERDDLDYAGEQRRVDAVCEHEVLKYLESSRVHAAIAAAADSSLFTGSLTGAFAIGQAATAAAAAPLAAGGDRWLCAKLMRMLHSGALRPLNRSSLWMRRRVRLQLALFLLTPLYCAIVDLIALSEALASRGVAGGETAAGPEGAAHFDIGLACQVALMMMANQAITYLVTTLITSYYDQALLVNRQLELIHACIRVNRRELYSTSSSTSSTRAERMNSNYLFALMSYKVFVRQFGAYAHTNRSVFPIAFSIAFIVPVLAHFHVPYVEQGHANFRHTILLLAVIVLAPVNAICLPMAYVHARCQKLYKALASLRAHVAEVRSRGEDEGGGGIYNSHAITVLAKELAQPRQMLEQFVVRSPGVGGGTFPTLVRLHFWWGLVTLTVLTSRSAEYGTELLGSFSRDPLGVYCFRLV